MKRRGAAFWLAWGLWSFSLALALLGAGISVALPPGTVRGWFGGQMWVVFLPGVFAYSTAGAVVASRHAHNAVGWLLSVSGVLLALTSLAVPYATAGLFVSRFRGLPAAHVMAWIQHWWFFAAVLILGQSLLLLFPNGRLPSSRWRPLAWLSIGAAAALTIDRALGPEPIYLNSQRGYVLPNPFAVPAVVRLTHSVAMNARGFEPWLLALFFALLLAGPIAVVMRWRAARAEERQQLKWFAFAGSLQVVGFVFSVVTGVLRWDPGYELAVLMILFGMLGLPVSVAVAILKYRLYAIDLIINRTLVYGALTATLAVVYWAGVVVLQVLLRPFALQSEVAVAGSTLAVAALFQPLRAHLQGAVDRRFFRRKYDAQKTLNAFSARLREEVDLLSLRNGLQAAVRDTVQPASVSLWLRPPRPRHLP